MSVRKIVKIDEEKCNGCGLCTKACAEGAIAIIGGKAKLISEIYCDGLGACLGKCPVDAIRIEERDAVEFDEEKVKEHLKKQEAKKVKKESPCGCPGAAIRNFNRSANAACPAGENEYPSELQQWPVQLRLVPALAPFLENAEIVLTADCVPFAFADFHRKILRGKALLVGCPKFDDTDYYLLKLVDILNTAKPKSLTVVRMEVPCCGAFVRLAEDAIERATHKPPLKEIVISLDGHII